MVRSQRLYGGSHTKFSVLLWAKALVLAQAQAEQKANYRQTIKDSTKILKKLGLRCRDERGGVKTVGTSSLEYRKPTYQILASYYAQNPPKSFRQVGGGARDYMVRSQRLYGGSHTEFSVLLWAKALVLAQAQAEQLYLLVGLANC